MAKVSLSGDEKSIEAIWSWYDDQRQALRVYKRDIARTVHSTSSISQEKFVAFTLNELDDYFEKSVEELEQLVAFDLIAAIEGLLRSDFYRRVYSRDKSDLGRRFRDVNKLKKDKISLEDDIINNWKELVAGCRPTFSELKGVLHYRHWLAHGRYWMLGKRGRPYSVEETYGIAESVLQLIP